MTIKHFSTLFILGLLAFGSASAFATCVEDATSLCLNKDRFQVEVEWRDEAGNPFTIANSDQNGDGQAASVTDDTGTFWLFTDQHHELLVKVLNGCPVNNHYWVFAVATTNVEYSIRVTDTEQNVVKVYTNDFGSIASPETDTKAFMTCPVTNTTQSLTTSDKYSQTTLAKAPTLPGPMSPEILPESCVADATTLCLHNNRFSVSVEWTSFVGDTNQGIPTNLTDQSGYFWFFSPENIELLINIYDGRASNGTFWVYFGGTTNIGYTLTVTDTSNGESKQYVNPLGSSNVTLDNRAFGVVFGEASKIPLMNTPSLLLLILLLGLLAWRMRPLGQ